MIKLVAFDWNSTLLSDTLLCIRGDNAALRELGIKRVVTVKELQECFDIPISKFWVNLGYSAEFFTENHERIYKAFSHCYEAGESKTRTRAGARQILLWLQKRNIEAIIFSNHPVERINTQLQRLKIDTYISRVFGRGNGEIHHMHKRSKEILLKSHVDSRKLKPSEILVVGDTTEEIDIAKTYGYCSVALTGGQHSVGRLKDARPDYIIHNLTQLEKIIKDLN